MTASASRRATTEPPDYCGLYRADKRAAGTSNPHRQVRVTRPSVRFYRVAKNDYAAWLIRPQNIGAWLVARGFERAEGPKVIATEKADFRERC